MRKFILLLTWFLLCINKVCGEENHYFTGKTNEGVDMNFMVVSAHSECQVGNGSSPSVNQDTKGTVTIPANVNGYSVTKIGTWAFYECSNIASIIIPNSVTSIGVAAFSDCRSLTSIFIPSNVVKILDSTFDGCSGLNSIVVERGNVTYDSRDNCNAIIETATNTLVHGCANTIIPDDVSIIGGHAFHKCSNLTSITLPNSVTTVGDYAFYYCTSLRSLNIPNRVTTIGKYAFNGCSGLTSITLPNSVTTIGKYAFYKCSGLTSVTIPNSVTSIGNFSFASCI